VEQHKVLLIIVSVTIVLAAIVGVGLWLFYPRDEAPVDVAQDTTGSGGFEWEPLDFLQGDGEVPGLQDEATPGVDEPDEFEVTYGVAEDAEQPGQTAPPSFVSTPVQERPAAPETTGRTPETTTPAAAAEPAARETGTQTAVSSPGATAAAAKPESAPATATSSTRDAAGTTSTRTGTPDTELSDRAYWVQAISSPNRETALQAKRTLEEHQLDGRILTRVINGTTYYRLRFGPFAVRAEAEKFLGWVQEIPSFGDAMIFVDYTTPVLAARPAN
jgi:DedD protein